MDRHYDEFSRFFKALGDPSRLQLMHILLQAEGSLSVSALGEQVSIGQSTVSQHLRILKDAGVIRAGAPRGIDLLSGRSAPAARNGTPVPGPIRFTPLRRGSYSILRG